MNFKLNLKKFHKLSGDKNKTVMRHEDGHEITIAHNALHPEVRKQLMALPAAFDEGGEIGGPDSKANQVYQEQIDSNNKMIDKSQGSNLLKNPSNPATQQEAPLEQDAVDPIDLIGMAGPGLAEAGYGAAKMGAKAAGNIAKDVLENPKVAQFLAEEAGVLRIGGPSKKVGSYMTQFKGEPGFDKAKDAIAVGEGWAPKRAAEAAEVPSNAPRVPLTEEEQAQKLQALKQAQTPGNGPKKPPMADGGPVSKKDDVAEPVKSNAEQVQKGATSSGWQPEKWAKNLKSELGMADGGEIDSAIDGPEPSMGRDPVTQNTVDPAPVAQNAGQPTIVINNTPAQSPQQGQPQVIPAQSPQQSPQMPQNGIASKLPSDQPQQQQAPAQDMYGNEAFNKEYSRGLAEQKQGLYNESGALGAQGKEQAAVLQKQIENQQKIQDNYKANFNQLEEERKNLQYDIQNSHIDPANYWQDHSKLATGIGIILAGFNPTASPNAAIEFLNQNMNRNLQAQRAELGKKENLLSANMKQFGNMRDATDMTRVMQADMVSNMLKQTAAKSASPLAQANALKIAGQLDMQAAPVMSQIAMRRTLIGGMQSGQVSPDKIVNFMVPEHQRADAVKELSKAQDMQAAKDNLLSAFDQLNQVDTIGNNITSPVQTYKKVHAIADPLIEQLAKDNEGRVTPTTVKFLSGLMPKPGDSEDTVNTKKSQLNKFVSEKMHFPILDAYGIPTSSLGRFNKQGNSNIKESEPVK